jgi:type I restriction enzyme S subunit
MRYVEKPLYDDESILIPRKGTLSNLFYLDQPFWSVDTMFYSIINKDLVLPKYLFYTLKTCDLASLNVGSAVPSLTTEVLNEVLVTIPNLYTQTAISEILSSLDDKIELNNKINQELETLAQTLFKQWFIDFEFPNEKGEPYKSSGGEMVNSELGEIPKGWDKIKLADLVTKSHTGADAITRAPIVDYNTGIKCARVGDMTNKRSFHNWAFCKIKPEDYKRQKLEIGDIIVTRTATLGINQIIRENIEAVCNNGLIRLQIDKSICDPMFVYIQLQGEVFKEWIKRISGDSSTRPNMQMDYLLDFNVIIPVKELMDVFTESIKTYFDLIDENNRSNEELIKTRDTLLPKLISGELELTETPN